MAEHIADEVLKDIEWEVAHGTYGWGNTSVQLLLKEVSVLKEELELARKVAKRDEYGCEEQLACSSLAWEVY